MSLKYSCSFFSNASFEPCLLPCAMFVTAPFIEIVIYTTYVLHRDFCQWSVCRSILVQAGFYSSISSREQPPRFWFVDYVYYSPFLQPWNLILHHLTIPQNVFDSSVFNNRPRHRKISELLPSVLYGKGRLTRVPKFFPTTFSIMSIGRNTYSIRELSNRTLIMRYKFSSTCSTFAKRSCFTSPTFHHLISFLYFWKHRTHR